MKTRSIARGIVGAVASLLGVVAVGCSAETGAPGDEAQIGSTAEALSSVLTSTNNPTDLTSSSPDMRRAFASACVLTNTVNNVTTDYLIRAGGYDTIGNPKAEIDILTKGAAPSRQTATLSQVNGSGQLVKVSETQCLYLGGAAADNSGAATKKVDLLTLSFPGGVPTISVTAKTDLTDARSNFVAGKCTDSTGNVRVWALGGQDTATGIRSLEISNTTFTGWTKTANALSVDRMNFGADIDDTDTSQDEANSYHIVAGGGLSPSALTRTATLDLIKLSDSDCSFVSKTPINTGSQLPSAADGNVLFFDQSIANGAGNTGKFVSAAGAISGVALETKVRTYTISWASTPSITGVSDVTSPTGFTSTFRPYVARQNSTDIALIGGANAQINTAIAFAQEYESAAWDSKATTSSVGMFGAVGGWMDHTANHELWGVNGESDPSPYTLDVTVDAWND